MELFSYTNHLGFRQYTNHLGFRQYKDAMGIDRCPECLVPYTNEGEGVICGACGNELDDLQSDTSAGF